MNSKPNRRKFIKITALSGAGIVITNSLQSVYAKAPFANATLQANEPATTFIPNRAASWWCIMEDIQWPQKHIVDKIKRRADAFAKAKIDTAINFGFHNRFDFANYFSQLHGYYNNVCEELHQRNIRFMDHYSCNDVSRPRNEADFRYVNKFERHAVLLFPDPIAAKYAQYEGHLFEDLFERDLRDGSHGYAKQYQFEAFCHNNPGFLDMHKKYLVRLMKDVPFDGVEVDDMCSYPANTTCGCKYCRDRFKKNYGHDIPAFTDTSFFGDTSKAMLSWGNYDNPAYRDWLRMKSDSVRDHVIMIKSVIGDKPLMTCCSNAGPIVLNAVALDLEKMAPHLDLFMLENVGTNIRNAEWIKMEAEALLQKDIAAKRGNAPAMALSYALSEQGAYFGWSLARFWGVSNWSSTLNGRLEEDPPNAMEMEDVISHSNNWEEQNSDLNYREGKDLVEIRLVNNGYCRENGWRDETGHEHWDRSRAWSELLVKNNIGYRFVRTLEFADADALLKENTPLILDGVGCVSDNQFTSFNAYLSKGGVAWMSLPFGTHNEKGARRAVALSDLLKKNRYKSLAIIDSAISADPLKKMVAAGTFKPVIKQLKGDNRWVARIRLYKGKPVIHFMSAGLTAIPADIKDLTGIPLIKEIDSLIKDNDLSYQIDNTRVNLSNLSIMSPESGEMKRTVEIITNGKGYSNIRISLDGIKIYAVAQ